MRQIDRLAGRTVGGMVAAGHLGRWKIAGNAALFFTRIPFVDAIQATVLLDPRKQSGKLVFDDLVFAWVGEHGVHAIVALPMPSSSRLAAVSRRSHRLAFLALQIATQDRQMEIAV